MTPDLEPNRAPSRRLRGGALRAPGSPLVPIVRERPAGVRNVGEKSVFLFPVSILFSALPMPTVEDSPDSRS